MLPTHHPLGSPAEDLTDIFDYASEEFEGMDLKAEADPDQNRPVTGRWTAISSYDVYMVDTPKEKEGDGENDPLEYKPVEEPPKRGVRSAEPNTINEMIVTLSLITVIFRNKPKTPQTR